MRETERATITEAVPPNLKAAHLDFLKQVQKREATDEHQAYSQALGTLVIASLAAADRSELECSSAIEFLAGRLNSRRSWRRRKAEASLESIAEYLAEVGDELDIALDDYVNCHDALLATLNYHHWELNHAKDKTRGPLATKTRRRIREIRFRIQLLSY